MEFKSTSLTFLLFSFIAVNLFLLLSSIAQEKIINTNNKQFYSLTGNQNDPKLTDVPPVSRQFGSKKTEALIELKQARESNNIILQRQAELKLNQLEGRTPVMVISNPHTVIVHPAVHEGNNKDYLVHTINLLNNKSVAAAIVPPGAPNAGRIWVVCTQNSYTTNDTMLYYFSDNGGASWTQYISWYYENYPVNYRAGELDLECVVDSTNVWLITVAAFRNQSERTLCNFARLKTDSTYELVASTFSFPGFDIPTNMYYNPRLTSDNISYPNSSVYLYFTCSFDSAYGNNQHGMSNKFALITGATTNQISIYLTQPSGSGFYWTGSNYPPTVYWYPDIAYYRTSSSSTTDRIFTSVNQNVLFNNIYLAWSDDYGATIAGNMVINETVPTKGAVLASSGLNTATDMMLLYLRQSGPSDWDVASQWTTTGGTTTGSWTSIFLDNSANFARGYPDITAVIGTGDRFKAAYNEDSSGTRAFYAGWNGTTWSSPSRLSVNGSDCDTVYGKVKAVYLPGTGDDCLALWSGYGGTGLFASTACQSTIGISNNNNEVPKTYALQQNYPNPFNPVTVIKYSIPQTSAVKLIVYNITGRAVKTLVNLVMNAGNYEVNFDASNIASGVYFYKFEARSFVETRKMMLIK